MPKRVHLESELPDEILTELSVETLTAIAKEALVMQLLREHRLSQGKAAEILGINRWDFLDVMTKYRVPAIDLTPEELKQELRVPLSPRPGSTKAILQALAPFPPLSNKETADLGSRADECIQG